MKTFSTFLIALTLTACGGGDGDGSRVCPSTEDHLAAMNAARQPSQPLHIDLTLMHIAQTHANYQSVRRQDLDRPYPEGSLHFDANGNRVQSRLAEVGYPHYAEEIAAAGLNTAEAVMQGYINSPRHNPWFFWPSANTVGLGCAISGDGRMYWIHILGIKQ